MTKTKARVACFIDGFNLYHSVVRLPRNKALSKKASGAWKNSLKWVDLNKLAASFITPSTEDLIAVYYFSAYARWLPDEWARHRLYVAALEAVGVKVIMGRYKNVTRYCKGKCKERYKTKEEKETDVNIAIHLLNHAHHDTYDKALLVTGDSDLIPVVEMVRANYPDKSIHCVFPPGQGTNQLKKLTTHSTIKTAHLENSRLPEVLVGADGSEIIMPTEYAAAPKPIPAH